MAKAIEWQQKSTMLEAAVGGAHGLRKKLDRTGLLEGGCQVQAFFSERMDESAGSDAVDGGGAAIVTREDGRDARGERGGGVARAVGAGTGGAILRHPVRLHCNYPHITRQGDDTMPDAGAQL